MSELNAHGTALAGLNCVVCSEWMMMAFPIRPISFVKPVLEGEGGLHTICAMIKPKVGSSLGSTIDHLVVLCSSFMEGGV